MQPGARALVTAVALLAAGAARAGPGFRDGPTLPIPLQFHAAIGLADGRVLITGGTDMAGNSHDEAWLYEPWSGRLSPAARMGVPHIFHTSTLLRDGRVLVVAGKQDGAIQNAYCELYDPTTNTWADAGFLATERERHTSTLLLDGRVFVAGSFNPGQQDVAEIFENATWRTLAAPPLNMGRGEHAAVRLADGRVLLIGGEQNVGNTILASTLLFDPDAGAWSPGPSLSRARRDLSAQLLTDGGVLVAGGRLRTGMGDLATTDLLSATAVAPSDALSTNRASPALFMLPDETVVVVNGTVGTNRVDVRNPGTGRLDAGLVEPNPYAETIGVPTVDGRLLLVGGYDMSGMLVPRLETFEARTVALRPAPLLPGARWGHTATLLPDGRVLLAGGTPAEYTAEWWWPDGGVTDAGGTAAPRWEHTASLLPNREVLLVGGSSAPTSAERCSTASGCRLSAPPLRPHARHATVLLDDGRVLVSGGSFDLVAEEPLIETYDPATDTWADAGQLLVPRHQHRAVVLPDGQVLIAAGYSNVGNSRMSELYDPRTGAIRPAGLTATFHGAALLVVLPDGRALLAGGDGLTGGTVEAWTADAGWVGVGGLPRAADNLDGVVARDDRLYVIGGFAGAVAIPDISRFEVPGDVFGQETPLSGGRYGQTLTLLPGGEVLVAGGLDVPTTLASVEMMQLGPTPSPRLLPVLDAVPAPLIAGQPHDFTGSKLTGAGEASTGNWRSSPAEAPTFRCEAWGALRVRHLGPVSWSATSARVVLPANLAPGWYQVTATVAGISSRAVPVRVVAADGAACASASICTGGGCDQGRCTVGDGGFTEPVDGGIDAGTTARAYSVACGCSASPSLLGLLALAWGLRPRRAASRSP